MPVTSDSLPAFSFAAPSRREALYSPSVSNPSFNAWIPLIAFGNCSAVAAFNEARLSDNPPSPPIAAFSLCIPPSSMSIFVVSSWIESDGRLSFTFWISLNLSPISASCTFRFSAVSENVFMFSERETSHPWNAVVSMVGISMLAFSIVES